MSDQLHLVDAPAWGLQATDLLAAPSRSVRWIFELVHARTWRYLRTLSGIRDFSMEHNLHATVRSGGSCVWQGAEDIDWDEHRLRVHYEVTSLGRRRRWTVGTFIVDAPQRPITASPRPARQLQLYDAMYRLDSQTSTAAEWVAPKGANIVDRVRHLLSRQSIRHSIEDSPLTFNSQMSWPAQTTYLQMTNDMLRAADFFAIWADPQGLLRAGTYRPPAARGVSWQFADTSDALPYLPDPELTEDLGSIPNEVVLTAASDDPDTVPISASARVTDPTNRLSFARRGYIKTHTESGVEAATPAVLQALAARRLEELTRVSRTLTFQHLPVPLAVNDVLEIRREAARFNMRAVVEKFSYGMDAGGLCTTTIREVSA